MKNKSFCFIIPAYNEADFIEETLQNLQWIIDKISSHKGQILVVDNNSNDQTSLIAKKYTSQVIFEKINHISKARNTGAKNCKADYFFFVDADTKPTLETIQQSLQILDSNNYAGGSSKIAFDNSQKLFLKTTLKLWNIISKIFNLGAGCFLFCNRNDFNKINGFNEEYYAAEDVIFAKSLAKSTKKKFKIIQSETITSARKEQWFSSWELMKQLIICTVYPKALKNKEKLRIWYNRKKK